MDESKEIELEVRKVLSSEVEAHREFLQSQFKLLTWGVGILFTVGAIVFVFLFGKSIEESKEQLISTIDAKVVDYRIVESFKKKLDMYIQISVEKAVADEKTKKKIDKQIGKSTAQAVSDATYEIEDKLIKTITQQVKNAQGLDAEQIISKVSMPKGAVLAFNRKTCPPGWGQYMPAQGRFILGSGKGSGLEERKYGDKGGEEKHVLAISEMPSHRHSYGDWHYNDQMSAVSDYATKSGDDTGARVDVARESKVAGSSGAHNNMPPFFVLTYCEKK